MAGINYKDFVQGASSTEWQIEHVPDLRSVMDVILSTGEVVQPLSVTHASELLTITFATPQVGRARLLPWVSMPGLGIPLSALYGEDGSPLYLETGEYLEFDA